MTFNPDLNALVVNLSEAIRSHKAAVAAEHEVEAEYARVTLERQAVEGNTKWAEMQVRSAQGALDAFLRAQ